MGNKLTTQAKPQVDLSSPMGQFDKVVKLIVETRSRTFRLANTALIDMYWQIGCYISVKISKSEWGDGVVHQLA